jgi:hypothetical protein
MDTEIKKPEQGVALAADLLKQDSQVEGESEPFVTPSEEDKLAAGISTIRLQTGRLSGAQQRKLTKAKKMKEGTWTVDKPKGKSPSSQEKKVAESSGGVKRPHSDSSTPPSTELEELLKSPGAPEYDKTLSDATRKLKRMKVKKPSGAQRKQALKAKLQTKGITWNPLYKKERKNQISQ